MMRQCSSEITDDSYRLCNLCFLQTQSCPCPLDSEQILQMKAVLAHGLMPLARVSENNPHRKTSSGDYMTGLLTNINTLLLTQYGLHNNME